MRVHGDNPVKVGLWLYRPERKSKRKAGDEWDPSVPVALAFVAPSDKIGEDPGKNRLNLHFGGRESQYENVVFKYHAGGSTSRMDCRYVLHICRKRKVLIFFLLYTPLDDTTNSKIARYIARCYQRVRPVVDDRSCTKRRQI